MDHTFDNSPIMEGDKVFVVGAGPGFVIDTNDDHFRIKVKGRVKKVTYEGVMSGDSLQAVFWRNPIIAKPAKEAVLWQAFARLALSLQAEFRDTLANQELIRVADSAIDIPVPEVAVQQSDNEAALQQIIQKAHQSTANISPIRGGGPGA